MRGTDPTKSKWVCLNKINKKRFLFAIIKSCVIYGIIII
jgi:hypothetical protein